MVAHYRTILNISFSFLSNSLNSNLAFKLSVSFPGKEKRLNVMKNEYLQEASYV